MCGIFGLFQKNNAYVSKQGTNPIIDKLFLLSESRGKEAAGIAVKGGSNVWIEKSAVPAHDFVRSKAYKQIFDRLNKTHSQQAITIGHSRLVTNGTQYKDENNQPVSSQDFVCVHNGIIVNSNDLWLELKGEIQTSELDTEPLLKLINSKFVATGKVIQSIQESFSLIEGAASIAMFSKNENSLYLITNTGSIYYIDNDDCFIFASEKRFLEKIKSIYSYLNDNEIIHLAGGEGIHISNETISKFNVELSSFKNPHKAPVIYSAGNIPKFDQTLLKNEKLRRCTKCILPETMPFIIFDIKGVCNYCNSYKPYECKPKSELSAQINQFKDRGKYDCLISFSGGRDSCYGLHILKNELGLNPLAITYDWGVVTDIARRNQARMCGALGVEHVLVSANISQKRTNIRKNLTAWLKRPHLGMLPLLMAGDKHFFYYSQKIAKENNINNIFFNVNPLERTEFKSGFMGIQQLGNTIFHQISASKKLLATFFYVNHFLKEPAYINTSLVDTAAAFFISYFMKHPYIELFDYFYWDESKINDILINEYNWETDPTTTTTWRIGDGTAPLYNYIYYHVVGFTENDTLRSNQIRQGELSREDALSLVSLENQPRYEAIRDYLNLIGMDFESTMLKIDSLERMY